MPRPVRIWTLLLWLAVASLGSWALLYERKAALRELFDLDARVLHRVLSQRLEQQETVLNAVAALAEQGGPQVLGRYVQALVRPYPQIVAVEHCGAGGCETLTVPRAALPTLPYAPSDHPTVHWPAGGGARYALGLGTVRVWVDAQALLHPSDLPRAPLTLQIFRPGPGKLVMEHASRIHPAALSFRVEKQLGTPLEPFPIRFHRDYSWAMWPWGAMAAWSALTACVAWGLARGLTARRQAERALLNERHRAQGIVEASTDGIVVLDPQGSVVQANPAAFGILEGLHPGAEIRKVAPFQATLSQAPLNAAQFWQAAAAQVLPDGTVLQRGSERVLVEGGLTPLFGEHGQLLGRVLTVREVGPLRQRMLAQLDAGEQRVREHETLLAHVSRLSTLGEMSAGLAHELNQPLTAIVSYGQAALRLLTEEDADLSRARQAVQGMVGQAQRSAEIIARLRTLVRRAPAQRVKVDLVQAAHNILTLCRADMQRLGVEVNLQFPPTAFVTGDPVQVEQIILNLVRNALDAMQDVPERRLLLSLAQARRQWTLTVQDSGTGLSVAALAHLFQPFQTAKRDGLGLGLSLSQTLAQGLGGDLSGGNAQARGARFSLALPQWTDHDPGT
ncbi:sensor histidine kinase [Deinococcus navajonensis]|uniref:histidine kinase n=1 Tax=Deinococcus navajonensis TaxID=309884 RepID=A0ABV8XLD7_9DEIO